MPILSTNKGHIDEARVKTTITRFLESLGKNEKSIWEYYNEMAEVEDSIREIEWQDLADTILVFDGLFAAFLSAFLVFTIPQLQPNSTDIAMDVLIRISQQLSNSTVPAYTPAEFTAPPSAVGVNVLLFISLALVLVDAFLAMLVKSWLQEFDRGWRRFTVAGLRAQEREHRVQGLERWKLAELVTLLPILIQASLLFFCVGLLVLLFPLHFPTALLSTLALVVVFCFYAYMIRVSIIDMYAPFSSPVSRGLMTLINGLQNAWTAWTPLDAIRGIIFGTSLHTSHPVPLQEYQSNATPSHATAPAFPGTSGVPLAVQPKPSEGVKKQDIVTRAGYQVDPQIHLDILERLIGTTEAVENIPIFLELLDQPVKDPTLRPKEYEWKQLLNITLRLLGDPSTFPESVACTIARTMIFCYNRKTVDQQLLLRLQQYFDNKHSDKTGTGTPPNSPFTTYFHFFFNELFVLADGLRSTIAYLEPSSAVDSELFWMMNTAHRSMAWHQDPEWNYGALPDFFAAVLTYVSRTEQSRRSHLPLTAAAIYAMHTIKSAYGHNNRSSIDGLYILPMTILTSESMTFCQVDLTNPLDLWSNKCAELTRALLQSHNDLPPYHYGRVGDFRLPLLAALYIESTKAGGHALDMFATLPKLSHIDGITLDTWGWSDSYDHVKLANYWYVALFRKQVDSLHGQNALFQGIEHVIMRTIAHCSESWLSSVHLLGFAVKHLCATTTSQNLSRWRNDLQYDGDLTLNCPPSSRSHRVKTPDPWILLHLDTLFVQSSVFLPEDIENLGCPDELWKVFIAKARLALYDRAEEGEHKHTPAHKRDPQMLKSFLKSNDYEVSTSAFKCWLNLVATSQPSAAGEAHNAQVFIPETIGDDWIEPIIQALCAIHDGRPWVFLVEHLVPKWPMLPSSWCSTFASVFMTSKVSGKSQQLPAYRCLAEALSPVRGQQGVFLSFIATVLEFIQHSLTWELSMSIDNWLASLARCPNWFINHDAHAQIQNILAIRMQQLREETVELYVELPMADSETDE